MHAEKPPTNYLELKEFLARNPSVKRRTFTRWMKRGLVDFCQPGGPNTLILVPEDALQRMEQRGKLQEHSSRKKSDSHLELGASSGGVRQPNWKKRINQTQNTKDNNA
jgi:hypothetical protein